MAPGSIEHSRGFVNMDATNEEDMKDTSLTNNEFTDERTGAEEKEKMQTKLKSLADLIHHCRDKGYQIYNDKTNIPKSDKEKLKSFKETHEENGKKHRADDTESNRRRKHHRNASISTHLGSTKNGDFFERQSRQTSGKSSLYGRSQMTSRMSNITTSTEQPVGFIDADEWHQIRMRRKSRKRRDNNGSLVDIIKKKQEEVETMSNKTQNQEKDDTKQTMQQTVENDYSQFSSKTEIPVDENVETIQHQQHEERKRKKHQHLKQNEHHPQQQQQQQQLNINSSDKNSKDFSEQEMPPNNGKDIEREIDDSQQCIETHEQPSPIRRSPDNSKDIIEEVRIKDGNATLVLYKVQEIKKSQSNIKMKNNNSASDWKETSNNDNLEDKGRGNPDDKNGIDESYGRINGLGIVNDCDISIKTQGNHVHNSHEQFNNSETSTAHTYKDNSSLKTEQRDIGVLDDTPSDTPSDYRGYKKLTTKDASERVASEHKYHNRDMISGDDKRYANATKEHDTEYSSTNIGRENDTHLVLSNHTNKRNTNNLDSKSDSSKRNVPNGGNKANTRENIVSNRSESNKEQTVKNTKKDMNSVTRKPPKRSLGNGFLVSSNNDDEDDDAYISVKMKTNSKKRALSEEKKQPSKASHEPDDRNTKSGTASTTSSKMSSLSPDARMILLLTKARQTNQEYGEDHIKTLDLLKETRLGLRNDYLKFRNGIDVEDEEPAEKEEPQEVKMEEPIKEEDSGEEEEEEEEEESENGEETADSANSNEMCVDVNGDIVKAIKQNASRKIDSRWTPGHRIFQKKSDGSKAVRTKRELKTKMINDTFDVSDLPNENEYVREAKRLYPKGFSSNADVKKKSENKRTAKSNNAESNLKKEIVAVEESKRISGTVKMTRESTKKVHENKNGIPQARENSRIKTELRKPIMLKPNANKLTNEPVRETAEIPNNIKTGERIRFTKVRNRPHNENGDVDNRLEIDRAFAKEYEMYLKNKQVLPVTHKDNYKATHNKVASTNKNNKENLPKIDNDVKGQRNKVDGNHNIDMVNGNVNRNSEYAQSDIKENKRDYVEDKSSNESISGAVDIVKSRGKFYHEVHHGGERRFQSRDSRVLKLFKEIQYVRRMVGPYSDRFPSNDLDDPSFSDPASGFLFMNYDSSCENRQLRGQRSDLALNRFLYEELDYEVCSKLKTVTMSHRRRDRAFEALRQRLFSKAY